jgi:asparagine synthase (glutamine-hydrolysing)
MPGLAGVIAGGSGSSPRVILERMVSSMLHEPTYSSGTFLENERLSLGAGWVCHRDSFSDCLPIWNEAKNVCLLFAGENFADQVDIDQLCIQGHRFARDKGNYLVHLYEETGDRFFERLNGVFAGLIIDLRHNKIVLFNDRYGLGRIYFHESGDGLYFASEAKAILKALPHLRRLDMRGFGEFFACGCVLQNRTLFPGISLLPPGSVWTFTPDRQVRKESYFDRAVWENQPHLSENDYYEKLKTTFARVLPRYFTDTDRIAMSLTGGLDGRMIMAWAGCEPASLPCYSHRGVFRECLDAKIARRVAAVCGQSHRTLTVGGSFFSEFPALASQCVYITDGCMDASGAASLFVNRIASREIGPIRMTGNYGSEILRGNVAFKPNSLDRSIFAADLIPHLENARRLYRTEKQTDPLSFIAFKQVPWHHYSRLALEQSQLTIRSPYLDNELVAVAYQAPVDRSTNLSLAARLIAEGNPELAAFPSDRGPLGRGGLLGKISEQFEEFTFKAEYAYDYGMPQWLVKADRALAPLHLERLFLGRHKYYHYRYWYRTKLAPYVQEMLLDTRSLGRSYLDRRVVENIVNAHVTGRGNYTVEIHNLLTAELMQRHLIEEN